MADTVTSQVIANGPRNLIIKFTNESDGTGESGVLKVDATSATYANRGVAPGLHLKVIRITYVVQGGSLRIQWTGTPATDMVILEYAGVMDYLAFAGLPNPANTGANGSISFTTVGFASGSSYTVTLEMAKCV